MKKILVIILMIIVVLGVCIMVKNKENRIDTDLNDSNIEISYESSGGFGTMSDTAPVTVTINGKKAVIRYENKIKKEISFDKAKFSELVELINKNFSKIKEDASTKMDVMDGSDSFITVKNLKTKKEYTVGGYMPDDKNFLEIRDKIYEVIDSDAIHEFRRNELNKYFEDEFSKQQEEFDEEE